MSAAVAIPLALFFLAAFIGMIYGIKFWLPRRIVQRLNRLAPLIQGQVGDRTIGKQVQLPWWTVRLGLGELTVITDDENTASGAASKLDDTPQAVAEAPPLSRFFSACDNVSLNPYCTITHYNSIDQNILWTAR